MGPSGRERGEFETLDCLGVHVARLTWEGFLGWFLRQVQGPGGKGICRSVFIVNAHTLNLAYVHPAAREALNSATLVLNDGAGLELYGLLRRRRFAHNFNGTDLVPRLLAECSRRGVALRVFLYGALPGRASAAGRNMAAAHSAVSIVGAIDGYQEDTAALLEAIDSARPDLLMVGLGNPLQEDWIARHAPNLDVKVAMGVGALFDFMSGSVRRAPQVLRALRLEWLYRLWLEPRRLFRRYVLGNPLFLWRTLAYRGARRL